MLAIFLKKYYLSKFSTVIKIVTLLKCYLVCLRQAAAAIILSMTVTAFSNFYNKKA